MTTTNTTNKSMTLQEIRDEQLELAERSREADTWFIFCQANPEYAFEANRKLIKEIHAGDEMTIDTILEVLPSCKDRLAKKGQERIETETVKAIIADKIKLDNLTPEQAQALEKLSVQQLKDLLGSHRDNEQQQREDRALPAEITSLQIKNGTPQFIRNLFKHYSGKMINARLHGTEKGAR